MAMIIDHSFDDDTYASFGVTKAQGAMSLSRNSVLGAAELKSISGNQVAWVYAQFPLSFFDDNSYFEADIEYVSDLVNRKHFFVYMVKPDNLVSGYRFAHLDSSWLTSKFNGDFNEVSQSSTIYSSPSFDVGERKRIKVVRQANVFSLFVNDVLVLTTSDSTYGFLVPGVGVYNGTIRIHSIKYSNSEKDIPAVITNAAHLIFSNYETRTQAWPGENSCKQTAVQTAKKAYGVTTAAMLNAPPLRKDFGFIEGVITRKTAPAIGQHVICLDDKFNLVAETLSGDGGHYRFDSLPINGLYAIHAYDNNEYKYAPVGADRRTPEAYS